eukprot:TRINITY_DN4684_c8_g1_i1.p1 TRINITY_DN4684_c8_g1~~TRINITY_DN4684_c8_g1_i1.p1  ORF type:complete len:760 (+),score=213.62 TRINITY_DN4684_c8_g1_i1:78-2282(+)
MPQVVLEEVFDAPVREVFDTLFGEELSYRFHEQDGHQHTRVGKWVADPTDPAKGSRKVRYVLPEAGVLRLTRQGPTEVCVSEESYLIERGGIAVDATVSNNGGDLARATSCAIFFRLLPAPGAARRTAASARVTWSFNAGGRMLRSVVEHAMAGEFRTGYRKFFDLCHKSLQSPAAARAPGSLPPLQRASSEPSGLSPSLFVTPHEFGGRGSWRDMNADWGKQVLGGSAGSAALRCLSFASAQNWGDTPSWTPGEQPQRRASSWYTPFSPWDRGDEDGQPLLEGPPPPRRTPAGDALLALAHGAACAALFTAQVAVLSRLGVQYLAAAAAALVWMVPTGGLAVRIPGGCRGGGLRAELAVTAALSAVGVVLWVAATGPVLDFGGVMSEQGDRAARFARISAAHLPARALAAVLSAELARSGAHWAAAGCGCAAAAVHVPVLLAAAWGIPGSGWDGWGFDGVPVALVCVSWLHAAALAALAALRAGAPGGQPARPAAGWLVAQSGAALCEDLAFAAACGAAVHFGPGPAAAHLVLLSLFSISSALAAPAAAAAGRSRSLALCGALAAAGVGLAAAAARHQLARLFTADQAARAALVDAAPWLAAACAAAAAARVCAAAAASRAHAAGVLAAATVLWPLVGPALASGLGSLWQSLLAFAAAAAAGVAAVLLRGGCHAAAIEAAVASGAGAHEMDGDSGPSARPGGPSGTVAHFATAWPAPALLPLHATAAAGAAGL